MKKLYVTLGLVLVATAVIVGAVVTKSGNHSMDMSAAQNAVATDTVKISNYMFSPAVIKVKAGTTVTWTNSDSVSHTVTADNPSAAAPSSMDIADGKSYSFTFKTPGTYTYHCFPHPYMHGTVEVTD